MKIDINRICFNPTNAIVNKNVEYIIEKPDIPMIYVDSNFIIEFTKMKKGSVTRPNIKKYMKYF
jgi:hypothetical protein